jgi:hypothetical protein
MNLIDTITQIFPLTEFQKRKKELFTNLYWPILQKLVPFDPNLGWGFRFPDAASAKKEAWACAHFHTGMLPKYNLFKIVENLENDPWQRFTGGVEDKQFLRAAGVYVIDNVTGAVYDHRVRYCIREPWAYRIGFVNPIFTWNVMGAPEKNPYKGYKNASAAAYYDAKGNLKK